MLEFLTIVVRGGYALAALYMILEYMKATGDKFWRD